MKYWTPYKVLTVRTTTSTTGEVDDYFTDVAGVELTVIRVPSVEVATFQCIARVAEELGVDSRTLLLVFADWALVTETNILDTSHDILS